MFDDVLEASSRRRVRSRLMRGLGGVAGGLMFVVMAWALAIGSIGAGAGARLPSLALFGIHPVIGLLVWPVAGLLAGVQRHRPSAIVGMVALAVSLVGAGWAVSVPSEDFGLLSDLDRGNVATALAVLLYVAAQGCLWAWFVRNLDPVVADDPSEQT